MVIMVYCERRELKLKQFANFKNEEKFDSSIIFIIMY